jgi:hypothetical protein
MIKAGSIVKYRAEWCSEGERELLHVVKENRMNPCTMEMTRLLIATICTDRAFIPHEVVDDFMVEVVGSIEEQ